MIPPPAMKFPYRFPSGCRWKHSGEPDNLSWTTIHDMNHCAPTHRSAWLRCVLRGVTLLLLPFWLPDTSHSSVMSRRRVLPADSNASVPYVRAMGSPALRFRDAPVPPPDLVVRPVAGGPPQPAAPAANSAPKIAESAAPAPSPAPAEKPAVESAQAIPSVPGGLAAPTTPPPSILPDETRPKVREEDFLPFFQFPASRDVTVIAPIPASPPAPGPAPTSSATYRQQ